LEVAHRLAFGYGHLTWEWQKGVELRGYTYPVAFSLYYIILGFFGVDTRWMVAYGPRTLQGIAAFIGDVFVYRLAKKHYGDLAGKCTLFVQIFSWFYFYCSVRTYSNSIEMVFTVVALFYWPSNDHNHNSTDNITKALMFAAGAVALRPSSGAFWVYAGLRHLFFHFHDNRQRFTFIFLQVLPIGLLTVILTSLIDRVCYGFWTLTIINFFKINIIEGVSEDYGVHSWHWYFTQGMPSIIGTWSPFFVYGVYRSVVVRRRVGFLFEFMIWSMLVLSITKHKEFRFAFPLLPIACCYAGLGLASLISNREKISATRFAFYQVSVFVAVISNVLASFYLSFYHQSAPLQVLDFLSADPSLSSVDFLTPCHSTPFHSHLHRPDVTMRFLDCSPLLEALRNLEGMNFSIVHGIEEEDMFFKDDFSFVKSRYLKGTARWPSHFVTKSDVTEELKDFFFENGYKLCASFFHTHESKMTVYCLL